MPEFKPGQWVRVIVDVPGTGVRTGDIGVVHEVLHDVAPAYIVEIRSDLESALRGRVPLPVTLNTEDLTHATIAETLAAAAAESVSQKVGSALLGPQLEGSGSLGDCSSGTPPKPPQSGLSIGKVVGYGLLGMLGIGIIGAAASSAERASRKPKEDEPQKSDDLPEQAAPPRSDDLRTLEKQKRDALRRLLKGRIFEQLSPDEKERYRQEEHRWDTAIHTERCRARDES